MMSILFFSRTSTAGDDCELSLLYREVLKIAGPSIAILNHEVFHVLTLVTDCRHHPQYALTSVTDCWHHPQYTLASGSRPLGQQEQKAIFVFEDHQLDMRVEVIPIVRP